MTTFIERLETEKSELDDKISKLNNFLPENLKNLIPSEPKTKDVSKEILKPIVRVKTMQRPVIPRDVVSKRKQLIFSAKKKKN